MLNCVRRELRTAVEVADSRCCSPPPIEGSHMTSTTLIVPHPSRVKGQYYPHSVDLMRFLDVKYFKVSRAIMFINKQVNYTCLMHLVLLNLEANLI